MRGDKSFAYDLIVRYGPVSSRVALLLRSAEGKPPSTRFVYKNSPFIALVILGPRRSFGSRGEQCSQLE
jgi:hypothetical protein